jgi:hypothetical protein
MDRMDRSTTTDNLAARLQALHRERAALLAAFDKQYDEHDAKGANTDEGHTDDDAGQD